MHLQRFSHREYHAGQSRERSIARDVFWNVVCPPLSKTTIAVWFSVVVFVSVARSILKDIQGMHLEESRGRGVSSGFD